MPLLELSGVEPAVKSTASEGGRGLFIDSSSAAPRRDAPHATADRNAVYAVHSPTSPRDGGVAFSAGQRGGAPGRHLSSVDEAAMEAEALPPSDRRPQLVSPSMSPVDQGRSRLESSHSKSQSRQRRSIHYLETSVDNPDERRGTTGAALARLQHTFYTRDVPKTIEECTILRGSSTVRPGGVCRCW